MLKNQWKLLMGFVFFSAFLFQGCGKADLENVVSSNQVVQENSNENCVTSSPTKKDKEKDSLLYFSNDVSIIEVSHSNSGGQNSWRMDKKDIPQFREWVLSLQLEHQNFKKDESPGDHNGGDTYAFQISSDTPLNFTYMDIGDNNHYIEIKGKWYLITNNDNMPDFLRDHSLSNKKCDDSQTTEKQNKKEDKDVQLKYVDIKDLPQKYTEDMAFRDGIVINNGKSIRNSEYLYKFLDLYSSGEDAMVRVLSSSDEGEPVIIDVVYKQGVFTMIEDYSRDSYTTEDSLVKEKFKYLVADNGLLYLSNKQKGKRKQDEWRLFAYIDNKAVWKNYLLFRPL